MWGISGGCGLKRHKQTEQTTFWKQIRLAYSFVPNVLLKQNSFNDQPINFNSNDPFQNDSWFFYFLQNTKCFQFGLKTKRNHTQPFNFLC